MLTPEQTKDRDRLRRYIQREQLTSVMSDTKWRRLLAVIDSLPFGVRFRCQDVREPVREQAGWDPDRYHVFGGDLAGIEWLEINARFEIPRGQLVAPEVRDHSAELRQALTAANVPFSIENGNVRVWGYTRPGRSPRWEKSG
jgi:hypothetical protein